MRWRWPWKQHEAQGNAAAAAKAGAQERLAEQRRRWPEVFEARDELARMAERATRRAQ